MFNGLLNEVNVMTGSGRPPLGMVKRLTNAKVACLDFSLQKTKMKMGVQVLINDPEKLDQIRQRCVGHATQRLFVRDLLF